MVNNIAFYQFVPLENLPGLRQTLRSLTRELGLKGTILLAPEGINGFLAGPQPAIGRFWATLTAMSPFQKLTCKQSISAAAPFARMLVKLKKEIIPMGSPDIQPNRETGPRVEPEDLCRWLDEGREVILIDTRNDYELAQGTFQGAVDLKIRKFREFGDALARLPSEIKKKPVVMFCTGGIRCEKATAYAMKHGFENVFQLEGGILKYFEKCGNKHYDGDCFVFDERVALNSDLQGRIEGC